MPGRVIAVAAAISALAAVPAGATPQSDFNAVYGDWSKDQVINRCYWSQAQLQNAYDIARSNPDFQYETQFVNDTQRELTRWKNGGCAGIQPVGVRRKSPLFGARIVAVRGRGGAGSERVTIRNRAKKALSFRRASITNLKGGGFYFPAGFRLARGRTAVVHVGCAMGRRRSSFTPRAVWLCSKRALFRDRGDLARLADGKLLVVSQRGFGDQRGRPSF